MGIKNLEEFAKKYGPDYELLYDYLIMNGLSRNSIQSKMLAFKMLKSISTGIDLSNLNEKDILKIRTNIVKRYPPEQTQAMLQIVLRQWLDCSEQKNLIELVKISRIKSNKKLPEEVLTRDEIQTLLENCNHPRNSALIALMYDSGCRVGELHDMRIKDVIFDDNGAVVTFPTGKTGWRKNRVVFAASYLRVWLDHHEHKNNPENPLWYTFKRDYRGRQEIQPLRASAVRKMIKETAERAGIQKRVHPHLFRHTRATELANHLTEQQLRKQFGWAQASNMPARYVHLTDKDMDQAILKASGVEVIEKENERGLKPIRCERCKDLNPPSTSFCNKCGYPMSEEASIETTIVLAEAMSNPEFRDEVTKMLSDMFEKNKK